MITVSFDSKQFMKDMNNIVEYSEGFIQGAQDGKKILLNKIGELSVDAIKAYIDSSARVNPEMLHHVYEWYQTGSPDARLFDIKYFVRGGGLSISSTFSQSRSVKAGSRTPFYDKARIMEMGIPVTIRPVTSKALSFEGDDGEQVFTKGPVKVNNPGGDAVQGSFQKTMDSFINTYFTQAFLTTSGVLAHLKDTSSFRRNLSSGKRMGKIKGMTVGYRWISNIGARI